MKGKKEPYVMVLLRLLYKACGYPNAVRVNNFEALDKELEATKSCNGLSFIEVKSSIGARDNLGRPTTTAIENKQNFIDYLKTQF